MAAAATAPEWSAVRDRPVPKDPVRQLVMQRAGALRLSLAELSRGLGRNESYMHQFIFRGSPRALPEDVRPTLAQLLGVQEQDLRTPPRPAQRRQAQQAATVRADLLELAPRPVAPREPVRRPPEVISAPSLSGLGDGRTAALPANDEVPLFMDTGEVAAESSTLDYDFPTHDKRAAAWALWITTPRDRLRPGDVAYVSTQQPPRVGDVVVAIEHRRVVTIGELTALTHATATIREGARETTVERKAVRVLKVTYFQLA